jgi:IS5 family transposase
LIQLRHGQPSLWHSGLAKDIEDLWEPWIKEVDGRLEDAALLEGVYQAQGKRHRHSRTRGRMQTAAEVALRLLILKHVRNWSYDELEGEVRANLVYRAFTRMGDQKAPDAKTLGRLAQVVGPEVIRDLHERVVALAREHRVVTGRKLGVDTTVVETNIHYPTDSNLPGDGAPVLTGTMKRIQKQAGGLKKKIRDRMRTVKKRVVAIALAARQVGLERDERHRRQYADLPTVTGRILNQAKGVLAEVEQLPRPGRRRLQPLTERLVTMANRVRQVVKQTRARIFEGITGFPGKLVSVFEPHTEIIRKGKLSKPTEFGKLVQVQEAENQIITEYRVFAERPSDAELLVPAVQEHQRHFGPVPRLVAADAGFYSRENEKKVQEMGVRWVAVPNRKTSSEERKKLQRQRWFGAGQRWRTGCEGRISVLKRRHGLNRCRYRGLNGMERWVGLGVIADNLIHIGCRLALQRT